MSVSPLKNKKILITAGPTREWMDPVRYLTNPSSGAMGIVLARTLQKKRARVVLVLGPTTLPLPKGIKVVRVDTALGMFAQVKKNLPGTDAFIGSAAVGDWRFAKVSARKLKKRSSGTMMVKLVKNPDILKEAKGKFIRIGFALETDNEKRNALGKLRSKKLDLIVANKPDSFANGSIHPMMIDKSGKAKIFSKMTKKALSAKIAAWLENKWNAKH